MPRRRNVPVCVSLSVRWLHAHIAVETAVSVSLLHLLTTAGEAAAQKH